VSVLFHGASRVADGYVLVYLDAFGERPTADELIDYVTSTRVHWISVRVTRADERVSIVRGAMRSTGDGVDLVDVPRWHLVCDACLGRRESKSCCHGVYGGVCAECGQEVKTLNCTYPERQA
jgi:hypothetical protein